MADAKIKSDAGGDKKDEKKGKDDQKEQELVYILKYLFIFQFETPSELKMPHNNTFTKKHKKCIVIAQVGEKPKTNYYSFFQL